MEVSAGILLYKRKKEKLLFFLVHPGGPFFKNKDEGYWTVPKGLINTRETPMEAAIREFKEETGIEIKGEMRALDPIIQKGGKKVLCWALNADIEIEGLHSNTFELAWPPNSDKVKAFPEIDKYGWFELDEAIKKINQRQIPFLEEINARMQKDN